MQFCFIRDHVSLVMPVTPGSYRWSSGKRMETINISQLGDVYRPGGRTRFSGSFDFLLPAQAYPWMETGARADPQYYLDYLTAWAQDSRPVRLVITGTEVNALVYLEEVTQTSLGRVKKFLSLHLSTGVPSSLTIPFVTRAARCFFTVPAVI